MFSVGLFGFATVAFAGTGIGTTVTLPSTVTVGDTGVAASIQFVNTSTAPDNVNTISISNITLSTTAGNTGVFSISASGSQHAGTSCGAASFTITPGAPGTWTVTPNTTLQPVGITGTCQIDFTVNILSYPSTDDNGAFAGTQAFLKVNGDAVNTFTGTPGNAAGTGQTTVSKASPSIATVPSAGGPVGTVLNDTATLSGGASPTGNVTFKLFAPSDASCSASALYTDTDGSAPYGTSPGFTSLVAGTYHWTADYAGDANNNATSSPCSAETVTVTKRSSSVTTTIHDVGHNATTSVAVGTGVHDNAVVSGSGPTPTGTISFSIYPSSSCAVASTSSQTVVLVGGVAETGTTTVTSTGLAYKAFYAGDSNYSSSVGDCETLQAVKLTPNVSTDVHNSLHQIVTTVPAGSIVHDSATVTGSGGTPTGTVNFTVFPNGVCTNDTGSPAGSHALNGSGIADGSNPEGPLSPGSYSFMANYLGDDTYLPKTGSCEPLTVGKQSPSISTTLSTTTSVTTGTAVHDSAALSGATSDAGGTVTYNVYSGSVCSGSPVFTSGPHTVSLGVVPNSNNFTSLSAGTYNWQAIYSGDANNNATSSPCQTEILVVTAPPAGQWCSHGYWKQSQHFDSWVGYLPSQLFSSVFENAFPGKTLLQVLQQGGGGLNALGRDTVGELLNTAAGLNTGFTTSQIIANFSAVFPGSNSQYDTLHATFVAPENCPLN